MRATRRPRADARPREKLGHVPLRHLDPTAFPSLVLARRLLEGLRHLGPHHRVGRVGHEVAIEKQLVLELGVLDEMAGPAATVEERPGEHHAVAVETATTRPDGCGRADEGGGGKPTPRTES